jgi:dihydrolipoamide dehydrogenase
LQEHTVEPLDYGNIPGCTYCTPEIASVGLTESQAKEQGYDIKVGKFPFSASGKAQAGGTPEGFVKVIFDAKYGEWLGCHMIGAGVTDMIAEAEYLDVNSKLPATKYSKPFTPTPP